MFFCFVIPGADHSAPASEAGDLPWSEEAGKTVSVINGHPITPAPAALTVNLPFLLSNCER